MKSRKTLTIGIPAYNEEANIGFLLRELLGQKLNNYILKEIVVSSDGSTDQTADEIKKVKSTKIKIMDNHKRKGRAYRQNQIMSLASADILILLDADIYIKDKFFIEKLSKSIRQGFDLASAPVKEIESTNFMDKILEASMKFKKRIFESINSGNNIYTCHGRVRAFSKRFYKKIDFKESVGEDAYSYLYCKFHNFKYKYVSNTCVYYKLPESFKDHEKQSLRFYKSQKIFKTEFGEQFVDKEYKLPFIITLVNFLLYSLTNPYLLAYIFIAAFLKLKSFYTKQVENTWSASASSKKLRRI